MILCFHELGKGNEYCCPIDKFKELIEKYPKAEIHLDDGRKGVLLAAPILKELNRTATLFIVPKFVLAMAPPKEQYSDFLTFTEIDQLIKEGFEIGSHSWWHYNLTTVSKEVAENEIYYAKVWLEENFKIKVTKFAFPFGAATEELMEQARKHYDKIYTLNNPIGIQRKMILAPDPATLLQQKSV